MAERIDEIPEILGLRGPTRIVRVPPEMDVPVTPRVLRILDTAVFRRLSTISQLGLVGLVYPGATHTRFEHSLGVYRNALLFLQRLACLPEFASVCSVHEAELLIVSSLLHDIGHWPFCHAIEDMRLDGVPRHEQTARSFLNDEGLRAILAHDWSIDIGEIAEILAPADRNQPRFPLLGSILSGPIDIDKLDYLDRDSLHAGVPYGRNFDRHRLISQLCVGPNGRSLAITDKARTAAEMMVFARYVMFSEVYWHHAVRSATCMLQRAVWELGGEWLLRTASAGEAEFVAYLRHAAAGTHYAHLVEGLFGPTRRLYKRLVEYHRFDQPELHRLIARRPYSDLVSLSEDSAKALAKLSGEVIDPLDVIVDAPPVKLEVQFNIQIQQSTGRFLALGDLSPVAQTLANDQFDNLVKRVRVFVHPRLKPVLQKLDVGSVIRRLVTDRPN